MSDADFDFPRVEAIHDYAARSPKEFSFRQGEVLMITDILDDNWYQGKRDGVIGCIPQAYVKHAKDWQGKEAQTQVQAQAHPPRPQHAAPPTPTAPHQQQPSGEQARFIAQSAPLGGPSPSVREGPKGVYPGGVPMFPGMVLPNAPNSPSGARRSFKPGATDDELIKAKPLLRQPDRPDLAKALNVRNQAARVGGPMKPQGNGNDLKNHLAQLKQKKMYKERFVNPHEAEMKQAMQLQSVKVHQRTEVAQAEAKMNTFDRKMARQRSKQYS